MSYSKDQAIADMQEWKYDYWGCEGYECKECPVMNSHIQELNPQEFYGVKGCREAQVLDIITRVLGINVYDVNRGEE